MTNNGLLIGVSLGGTLILMILGVTAVLPTPLFLLIGTYFWLHFILGPLDWYLLYKLYKKIRKIKLVWIWEVK